MLGVGDWRLENKMAKETKWCPQHGYPLPCDKCGLGLRELGRRDVVEWVKRNCPDEYGSWTEWSVWQKQLKEWGIK